MLDVITNLTSKKMELSNYELKFQKQIVDFCEALRLFYNGWKSNLEDYKIPLQALLNLSEQLQSIEKVNLYYFDHVVESQKVIRNEILSLVEDGITKLKSIIDKLNEITRSFGNKLTNLETNSLNLDWSKENELMIGGGCQPSLERLLENSFIVLQFFKNALKRINECYKVLDIRNEETIKNLDKSFSVDLSNRDVLYLLAITQYVGNDSVNRL